MQTRNQVSLIRKALYGVMSFGIVFSVFGAGNLISVRAQEGEPDTPAPEVQVGDSATPVPEAGSQETTPPIPGVESQFMGGQPTYNNQYLHPLMKGGSQPSLQAKSSDLNSQALTLGAPGLSFRYLQTFGEAEKPYNSDTTHLNRPEGLFMDGSNNLFVVESQGSRVLRYDSSGNNTLAIGKAGMNYTDDYVFSNPTDTALDSDGNIWVSDWSRVVQYNPTTGKIMQSIPAQDDNPWQTGSTHGRFKNVRGIAFGSDARIYFSDSNNNRVEIYVKTGPTTLGFVDSIGTEIGGFDSPGRIAVYGDNDLYVVDTGNNRVQHCVYSIASWSCSTLVSGLNNPQGITVDSSQNVYIADTNNGRILKCTSGGSCTPPLVSSTHSSYPSDVAVDSFGNIYSAEYWSGTVVKYDSSGMFDSTFVGVYGVPYLTDSYHYNQPRVAIDSSNNIIIVEEGGKRLTKLDASGAYLWSVGFPGMSGNDDTHLNWPQGVAVDKNDTIYVANNDSVKIFSGSGTLVASLGTGYATGYGTGPYQFNGASGIAVDSAGVIYVSDCNNHRVQVYNSSRTYVTQLGETGVSGSLNDHFNCPRGIGVDSARNIYVADSRNNRVQKFNSNFVYQTTLGTIPSSGSEDFGYFGGSPEDVAVDTQGRIYVGDNWNNRVQVLDSNGAYLTTIGGNWGGTSTSQFRNISSVDVDVQGNVYIADSNNHRIQKFIIGTPNWAQTNLNGFGDRNNRINSMASFGGQLYAGTFNYSGNGAQLWRSSDGRNWSSVMTDGFGVATNLGIDHLIEFNGKLYAGTWNSTNTDPATTIGGQIWRSSNGTTWEQVVTNGFGEPTINGEIMRFSVFNNQLYAATWSWTNTNGAEIWRSDTGDIGDWTKVVDNGLSDSTNVGVVTMETFNGYLYAGTYGWNNTTNLPDGCEVWRTDGTTWTKIVTDSFGNSNCYAVSSLVTFGDALYAATGIWDPITQTSTGGQVWRCTLASTCDAASDWTQVIANGFGNPQNDNISSLCVFDGRLYAITGNYTTGLEVWRTSDGTTWNQSGFGGFGDSNNNAPYWDNSAAVFNNSLFIGTRNSANGGEIWQLLKQIYLPLIRR